MAADSAPSHFKVLIIGAGSVGLLVSQYLKKLGIKSTIYERESYLNQRPRDWNFGIFWAQAPLAECLPEVINARLLNARVDPSDVRHHDETLPLYNAATGEMVKKQPTPGVLRLRRSAFREVVADGLDIKYDKRLQTIQLKDSEKGRITACFEDGTEAAGDLLIGADGAKSLVRDFLLGAAGVIQPMPLVGCSTCGSLPGHVSKELFDTKRTICVSFHPDGLIAYVSLHELLDVDHPESWKWMLILTYRYPTHKVIPDATEVRRIWDSWSSKLAEPFRTAFLAGPEKAKLYCERISQWPTIPWNNQNGKVTLAGDAAHPMTFHRGQGLSNAIDDAAYLCRALKKHRDGSESLSEAISGYEKEVVKRGHDAVISSGENSMMVTDWSQLTESSIWKIGIAEDKE